MVGLFIPLGIAAARWLILRVNPGLCERLTGVWLGFASLLLIWQSR